MQSHCKLSQKTEIPPRHKSFNFFQKLTGIDRRTIQRWVLDKMVGFRTFVIEKDSLLGVKQQVYSSCLHFPLSQNSQQLSQFSNGLTQMNINSPPSTDSPTVIDPVVESLPGTSQMLNNADTLLASPEKAIRRKRRTQAEMLQDARKKLAEANKNN
jgi:hypothetical protein